MLSRMSLVWVLTGNTMFKITRCTKGAIDILNMKWGLEIPEFPFSCRRHSAATMCPDTILIVGCDISHLEDACKNLSILGCSARRMLVILALRRLRQEGGEVETSVGIAKRTSHWCQTVWCHCLCCYYLQSSGCHDFELWKWSAQKKLFWEHRCFQVLACSDPLSQTPALNDLLGIKEPSQ